MLQKTYISNKLQSHKIVVAYPKVRSMHVEELLVVVHPDLHGARCVYAVSVHVSRERVRVKRAEDVADPRTRHCLHCPATLPNLQQPRSIKSGKKIMQFYKFLL